MTTMTTKPADLEPARAKTTLEQANQALFAAQLLINQGYLDAAQDLPPVPFEETGVRPLAKNDTVRLYNISKIVYDRREDALDNLLNVYSALGNAYGLAFIIQSQKEKTSLYIAIRAYSQAAPASEGGAILEQAIAGHFPGSGIYQLDKEEIKAVLGSPDKDRAGLRGYLHKEGNWGLSAAVAIPSLKDEEKTAFTQGIERLMDAMEGEEYTAVLLAEPFSKQAALEAQTGFEDMLSHIYACAKQQLTLSQRWSDTVSTALTSGFSTTFMRSLTRTQTHSTSETKTTSTTVTHTDTRSKTTGKSWNFSLGGASALAGGALGFAFGGPVGAIIGSQLGGAVGGLLPSYNRSESETNGYSDSTAKTDSTARQTTYGTSEGETVGRQTQEQASRTDQKAFSRDTGISSVFELRNAQAERLARKIESHLERLEAIRSFGAWEAGAFFISPDAGIASKAASIYLGALRGEDTHLGNAAVITWRNNALKKAAMGNLAELSIPRLILAQNGDGEILPVTPAAMISSRELSLMMNFPRRSVGGVTVLDSVGFGREKRLLRESGSKGDQVKLGRIYHLFKERPAAVTLNRDDFTRHVLVTGTTGTGKSATIREMLRQLHGQRIPFMVLEPAKSEYAELAAWGSPAVPVFQVGGREHEECLRLNPFVFSPEGNTLMEHIDRLCALFNAAFPMYAAMPQILEEAIVRAYERCGWDLTSSSFMGQEAAFPSLLDVAAEIEDIVVGAGYAGEARSTYIGALKTRITSLMRGSLGLTFGVGQKEETPPDKLFEQPCVVNLASLGSAEKKAIVMGMLLIRLQEHRLAQGQPPDDRLRHLMVMEEAHNLLKRASEAADLESADPRGQAVEYFSNLIAELRAYGQGFLIADQSVSALDASIQRNTNTKIAFCAPFETDREILAGALSLDEEQKKALARLESHTAIVKQNDWADAVQCRIKLEHTQAAPLPRALKRPARPEASPVLAKALRLAAASSSEPAPNRDILAPDAPDDLDLLLWVRENSASARAAEDDVQLWKAVSRGKKERLSEKRLGQALYIFPEIRAILKRSLQCTSTPEGLASRLRVEILNTGIFSAEADSAVDRAVHLLLKACDEDNPRNVAAALKIVESQRRYV